jgi:glutamate carboxypeptidase
MTAPDDAATWLSGQSRAMEATLAELVSINSFTENVEGGNAVGRRLSELFGIEGFSTESVPSQRGTFAEHLVIRSQWANPNAAPVALVGHLDTVFPPGTFEGYKRDGELARGPGVLDMKGGLVVVAWALKALAQTTALESLPPIRLVIVSDEEVGSPEGKSLIVRAVGDATRALVFEAGRKGDLIITRRKGTGSLKLVAHGRAAHAGNAHREGVNALRALAKMIDRVEALTDYARGVTVNVGKVTGGTSKNTVPDRAEALVDLRFETREDAEALMASVTALAEACAAELPGSRIEIEGGLSRLPLERTAASEALMNVYAECARRAGLGSGEAPLIGGGSDASTTHAIGIASIDGLGPRGIGFHTHDEQIEVATLRLKAEALARTILALGTPSHG